MKNNFYELERDGVTQGLLQKFMSCRMQTRIFLEGWSLKSISSVGLNFGSIIHGISERVYRDIMLRKIKTVPDRKNLRRYSAFVEKQWYKDNPRPTRKLIELTEMSFAIAEKTMPLYFDYWKKDDFKKNTQIGDIRLAF